MRPAHSPTGVAGTIRLAGFTGLTLLLLLPVAGCDRRGDGAETGAAGAAADSAAAADPRTASSYTRGDTGGLEGTHQGAALEAPRQIPAVTTQLQQLESGAMPLNEGNRNSHRQVIAELTDAMEADLNRVGKGSSSEFIALRDSIVSEIGGGAGGAAPGPKPDELKAHTARIRRLIAMYEQAVGPALQQSPGGARR